MAAVMQELLRLPVAEDYRMDVIVTYRTPRAARRAFVFALALARLAGWCLGRGRRIAHVHATVRGSLLRKSLCVWLAHVLRRPVVLHVHAGAGDIDAFAGRLGVVGRRAISSAFDKADSVLAVSAASAARLEHWFGRVGIVVVPNPAPEPGEPLADEDDAHGVRLQVLYLGGFQNRVKGGDVLVAALPAITELCPRAVVTLAGPGEPSRQIPRDGVHWAGWLDGPAKRRALQRADVFILPSRSEGLPVAILEAMVHGLAIVASRVGGIPEVLEDGRDAILVEPDDPAALASAVADLAGDPDRRESLGAAARRRASSLNRDDVSARLSELYRTLP